MRRSLPPGGQGARMRSAGSVEGRDVRENAPQAMQDRLHRKLLGNRTRHIEQRTIPIIRCRLLTCTRAGHGSAALARVRCGG